jgi:hypothetical protein
MCEHTRDIIRSGLVSSGPHHTHKINSTTIYNAQRYRESMGNNLNRRWTKMLEMAKKSKDTEQKTLDKCIPASVDREENRHPIRLLTSEYLELAVGVLYKPQVNVIPLHVCRFHSKSPTIPGQLLFLHENSHMD